MLNRIYKILYFILICLFTNLHAQDSLKTFKSISVYGKIDFFEIDPVGNIYQIFNDELIKLNPLGVEMYRYSNKSLGRINQIDVSNSLRPLIFYKDLAKIVVLDNTLSEQDSYNIHLDELGYYRALTIANSNVDNGVWMFDQDQKQIIKVNNKLELIQESGNLAVLLQKSNIWPTKMLEKNGRLYMATKNDGLLIFDIYCSYLQTLDIQNTLTLQIEEEFIYTWDGSNMQKYNSKTHDSTIYILDGEFQYVLRNNGHFIALSKDGSSFYFLNSTAN